MTSQAALVVHSVYESSSGTWQYIVADPSTNRAAIIDPVLDFDAARNEISTKSADELLGVVAENGYQVDLLLETHLHADHLSGASQLQQQLKKLQHTPPSKCIGNGIEKMQQLFASKYGVPQAEWTNAFDKTFADGEIFNIGNLVATVQHLPGHTPDHVGYQIGENVFTGDSIFNPDLGSARCDFPQGSAAALWNSMQRLLSLPPQFKLYTGHDYPPADRNGEDGVGKPRPYATVAEHKASNKHVKDGTEESTFVSWRTTRDAGLNEPKLINQALQFNIRAGNLPKDRMVHVPLKFPERMTAV